MEKTQTYDQMKDQAGLVITYIPDNAGGSAVKILSDNGSLVAEAKFGAKAIDEAHILYMEATELLRSRAKINEDRAVIRKAAEGLLAIFRGEKTSFEDSSVTKPVRQASGDFTPNPGKNIEIDVDGVMYERLPVRTRLITMADTDLMPLIAEYAAPYLKPGDILFVSEKALTITQGRVVDMHTIKPTPLARFLARNVQTYYGSAEFHGFGHGTALAMQLFIEEAGYPRILFAGAISAITRPFGLRGMFYRICGERAKSIDCPMSFLILEYAHSAKLAPNDPTGAARAIKKRFSCEAVILDANYRGAFSLGKTNRRITEEFIGKAFRDNPAGQSDEMTPFLILRKKTA